MKKKKRLLWQIYPYFLLVILISVIAVSWYASSSLRTFFLDQTITDLDARARLLASRFQPLISTAGIARIDRLCKTEGRASNTRITVILPSGEVLGDTEKKPQDMENHADRPEVIQARESGTGVAVRYSATLEKNMMYVAILLKRGAETPAVLRTAMSIARIDEEVRRIQRQIIVGGVLIALIVALISLYISHRISTPVQRMKKGAEAFASGDLTYRLPSPESEEMAGLAKAMNEMAVQLDERIKTIDRQRNELETVFSSMGEGIIAIDEGEHILSINKAAAAMFQLEPHHHHGRILQEVIRNNEFNQFIREALTSDGPIEKDINLFGNGEQVIRSRTSPLYDEANQEIGILIVIRDVTQLRRLETMRQDFVVNVSHELKTPLTTIKGFVETLNHGAIEDAEESERFLGIIEKHVNRLAAILEDLTRLSRIEIEGKQNEIILEKGAIKEVLELAAQVCQRHAEDKNIRIDLICDESLTAQMDASLIEQAVVNLLDNAIKYSEEGGSVQAEAKLTPNEILIEVRDEGVGIAKEHLPRLFERFYRVDKARSRNLGGTGLGLSIVKHITQVHGGRITVDSAPGKGSRFTLRLPVTNG